MASDSLLQIFQTMTVPIIEAIRFFRINITRLSHIAVCIPRINAITVTSLDDTQFQSMVGSRSTMRDMDECLSTCIRRTSSTIETFPKPPLYSCPSRLSVVGRRNRVPSAMRLLYRWFSEGENGTIVQRPLLHTVPSRSSSNIDTKPSCCDTDITLFPI